MRLLVLALTALAFAQPALAREHYRHHHLAYAVHPYHHLARTPARHHAWRSAGWHDDAQTAHVGSFDRDRAWRGEPMSDRARPFAQVGEGHGQLDSMIARHAQQNGLPEALVHRVVIRESRYHPGVVGAGGAMGLMQIKLGTAREMGYAGTAAGLLDPETNLTYAVRYLAGAYRVAGGNADRAVANYARGYRDTTVREGAASARRVASADTSGWSNSYASAGPIERVAWVHAPTRHIQHRRLMRSQ
jgi:soluble lytic murein transglycosylase-like protein